jgi:hypothetical protein
VIKPGGRVPSVAGRRTLGPCEGARGHEGLSRRKRSHPYFAGWYAQLSLGPFAALDEAIPELRLPTGLPTKRHRTWAAPPPKSAEREGFEPSVPLRVHMISKAEVVPGDPRGIEKTSPIGDPSGPEIGGAHPGLGQWRGNQHTPGSAEDQIELELARALGKAADAARFDVVAQLSKELEARRLARLEEPVVVKRRVVDGPRRGVVERLLVPHGSDGPAAAGDQVDRALHVEASSEYWPDEPGLVPKR